MNNFTEAKDTAKTYLETLEGERWFDAEFDEVASFICTTSDELTYESELIHSDEIEHMVSNRLEEYGWKSVSRLLIGITDVGKEWYNIDAHGAITDLKKEKLIIKLEALLEAIEESEEDDE